MTELELASRLSRDLGVLATDAGWSTDATAGQAQGHYTDPIADAMDSVGVDGDLDDATKAQRQAVTRKALMVCIDRLMIHYAAQVDEESDGTSRSSSQTFKALEEVRARVTGRMAVGVTLRGSRRPDYTVDRGNAPTPTDVP